MLTLEVLNRDEDRAWTNWSGRGFRRKSLSERLKQACPSLRLNERKRFAQALADGLPLELVIEKPESAGPLFSILDATGVVYITRPNPAEPGARANAE